VRARVAHDHPRAGADVILTALVAAGVLAFPAAAGADTDCGLTSQIHGRYYHGQYLLLRLQPGVSCATVKRVSLRYLRDGTTRWPWVCRAEQQASPIDTTPIVARCARRGRTMIAIRAFQADV
jgi:hypothetical protein